MNILILQNPLYIIHYLDSRSPDILLRERFQEIAATHGLLRPQNISGAICTEIRDGGILSVRASMTRANSSLHTDHPDAEVPVTWVGLLCLVPAKAGGELILVDGQKVAETIKQDHPEDYTTLIEKEFLIDCRSGVALGEPIVKPIHIIDPTPGKLVIRYLRDWIEGAHRRVDRRLDRYMTGAMDRLDEVASYPKNQAILTLNRGDVIFFDNKRILHGRTSFEDHQETNHKRHLVRMWAG